MADNQEAWLEIGKIVAPQGLKGEVRVNPSSDFPERFLEPGQRWLQCDGSGSPRPVELLRGYQIPGKNLYVLQLTEVTERNQAEALRGCRLLVPASDRPKLAEDEYHVSDLINLEVYNQLTGESIGTVIDVFSAGSDLLEVKLHQQPILADTSQLDRAKINRKSKIPKKRRPSPQYLTVLIPFVKEIVPVVDIAGGKIEVNPPAGLLDNVNSG